MLEFRFGEHTNRNYNTMNRSVGGAECCCVFPCVCSGRRPMMDPLMTTLRASSNDRFPIWKDQLMLRRP